MLDQPVAQVLINEIPDIIRANITSNLIVEGSAGKGQMAEIPHVCLFDTDITDSAERGYYIVYLFSADGSRLYISLIQGWTDFSKKFPKAEEAYAAVSRTTMIARQVLTSSPNFSFAKPELFRKRSLGKGYELGNICSKVYLSNQIPSDEELMDDLRELISIYQKLKWDVGTSLVDYAITVDEWMFQESIQSVSPSEVNIVTPISKPEKVQVFGITRWKRNPQYSAYAIRRASYLCEYDENHTTFIARRHGHNFVEAHHLVPMEFQDRFEQPLDVPENILSLCPNCHRAIHHSREDTKKEMISKFLVKRKTELEEAGLLMSADDLLKLYSKIEKADDLQ